MKKLISILMVLCMSLSLLPAAAFAEDIPVESQPAAVAETAAPEAPVESEAPVEPEAAAEPEASAEPEATAEPETTAEPEAADDAAVQAVPRKVVRPDTAVYYTYEFHGADGSMIGEPQTVKAGDTLYEPTAPSLDHKRFLGWFDASGNKFTAGTVGELTGSSQTIVFTANYEDVYYVIFKDDSDRVVVTKEGIDGAVISCADVRFPVGSDQALTGWKYGDVTLPADGSVTVSGADITLTAIVEKGFWIIFESNGGSYTPPQFVSGTAAAPAAPTRFGYTFAGWYTDNDTFNSKAEDFSAIKSGTTLYAKWDSAATIYSVIHWQENPDDDNYSYKESEVLNGVTGTQTAAIAKSYDGFTVLPFDQAAIAADGSTIINIYYKRNVYDVKFWNVLYDGSHNGDLGDEFEELRITAKYGANIRGEWPTMDCAWETSIGSWHIQANIDIMPLGGQNFYRVNPFGHESAEYYIEDLDGNYILDHTDTGAPTNAAIAEEDCYPIQGFHFDHYVAAKTFFSERDQREYDEYGGAKFYYKRNTYNIDYMNGSDTPIRSVKYKYEADISAAADFMPDRPDSVPDSYVFDGWYYDETCTAKCDFRGKTMPYNNVIVYAKWVAPTFTVTVYDSDRSTVLKTFSKVPLGSAIDEDEMPTPALTGSESLLGWALKDGSPFSFSTKINRDYELYAITGNSDKFTVTYAANDGTSTVQKDPVIYAKGAKAVVLDNAFTAPDGKVFLGWNTAADGSKTMYYPNGSIEVPNDITLYAIWGDLAKSVSVTYHANDGSSSVATINALPNNSRIEIQSYDSLGLPVRPGYSFLGWSTARNGSVEYKPGDHARVDSNGSNDLYAQWEFIQYKLVITGQSATKTYTGDWQELTDFTVEGLPDGFTLTGITYLARGLRVGSYDGRFSGTAVVTDKEGNDMTQHCTIEYAPGVLKITSSPKTGDSSALGLWLTLLTASALGGSAVLFLGRKHRRDEE